MLHTCDSLLGLAQTRLNFFFLTDDPSQTGDMPDGRWDRYSFWLVPPVNARIHAFTLLEYRYTKQEGK
jgi:hypothetical protein